MRTFSTSKRRRTMERNHRKLMELGLVGHEQYAPPHPPHRRPPKVAEKRAGKRAQPSKPVAAVPMAAVRRSLRARKETAPKYAEDTVGYDDQIDRFGKRPRRSCTGAAPPTGGGEHGQKLQKQALPLPEFTRARPRESKPLPPDSSRNLECDIPMLVEEYLGRSFPAFGKAPVMELSTKSRSPKFSRMSGVTEWKNAVFLWVNVDEGEGYANLFERILPAAAVSGTGETGCFAAEGPPKRAVLGEKRTTQEPGKPDWEGRDTTEKMAVDGEQNDSTFDAALSEELRMTWYAGGRMVPESALIRRLLKCSETGGDCEAAESAVVSLATPDDDKLEGGVSVSCQQGGFSVRPRQGGEGSTRNTAKATVDLTETAAVAAEVGPNDATSTHRVRAQPESAPHKQAKNDGEGSCKSTDTAVESAAGKLGYAEHWSAERPVRFVWRLLDARKLALQPDFGSIVEAAGIAGGGVKLET
eukprot:jgi/Undpi1/3190/HiC_scaffold_15.g06564.m1